MTIDFAQVVSSPPTGRTTALIIDHAAYAQQVLLRGAPLPWLDDTAFVSLLAQAEGLLKPDATLLDIGAVLDASLAQDADLVAAMGARTRVGYALKTLLAHEGTAERVLRLASVVSRSSRLPLILQVPGPATLAARAHVLAGAGQADDVTADHAENLTVYLADWLRRFSSLPVSLLLLDGRRAGSVGLPPEDLAACTPVLNAAEHYRWAVGLRTDDGVQLANGDLKGVAVPADYWLDADVVLPVGDFRITELPGSAEPERVLARLAELAGER